MSELKVQINAKWISVKPAILSLQALNLI